MAGGLDESAPFLLGSDSLDPRKTRLARGNREASQFPYHAIMDALAHRLARSALVSTDPIRQRRAVR